MVSRSIIAVCALLTLAAAAPAGAKLYSYENEDGDYVISKERPNNVGEYAVLTNDGEFIELVHPLALDVPITHWRPWYLPKQLNPLDPSEPDESPEPTVTIEEVNDAANE